MKHLRGIALGAVAVWFCLSPSPASAHLASTGMGPLYDGWLHFFLSPEDVVPAVALAMFAGQRGADCARRALFVLPVSWFAGCLAGTWAMPPVSWPVAAISFLVFGGLVATNAQVSARALTWLAIALGLIHGSLNGAGMRWAPSLLAAYAGLAAGVAVVVALVSALVLRVEKPWARIVVRVAGSWIVASGLLLLGWSFRQR